MIIANFREYVSVLRDVYSRDAMGEIGRYYQELMRSGKEVGEKKQKLKEKIVACNRQIDRQAALLRQSADKRTAGIRLAEIRRQKCELVKNLKALQQTDHFIFIVCKIYRFFLHASLRCDLRHFRQGTDAS